jgi:hypothetical protein
MTLYKNECKECLLLGQVELKTKRYDLYYCTKDDTVIARFGNGQKVIAGMKTAKKYYDDKFFGDPLAVAYSIAKARHLI